MPDWAPARRCPDKDAALKLLEQHGQEVDTTSEHFRLLRHRVSERERTAKWVCIEPEHGSLIFGGNYNRGIVLINVIDTVERKWIAMYRLSRRKYPQMPCD